MKNKPANIQKHKDDYGLDVVDELSKMLSEHLAKEIDASIIKDLLDPNIRMSGVLDRINKCKR